MKKLPGSSRELLKVFRKWSGAEGGSRTPTGIARVILSHVRLPVPPLRHEIRCKYFNCSILPASVIIAVNIAFVKVLRARF